ncbi:hypothetical protein SARC_03541 [Sphaeroforma arctica JP610]|uniref:Uncharacterized protein n=1 Tax=Sphaeroforma arctica JP610 TaxID=667725 RepID=A0A0L0G5X4_9EUKA|nr:hypothetical protein SARC_03541 [Sphaeroforma arctica JP610]KNC84241.1 hypothetical protein SARC_03541 [Sphaeroforma arctica JP610]|eukprot:XP_014158143.1 hypothetical protein SARC_03541 [Sphaeroforma arctica JP610]
MEPRANSSSSAVKHDDPKAALKIFVFPVTLTGCLQSNCLYGFLLDRSLYSRLYYRTLRPRGDKSSDVLRQAFQSADSTYHITVFIQVLDDAQRLQEENGALKDKLDSQMKRGIELEYQHSEAQQLDKKQIAALTVANEQAQAQETKDTDTKQKELEMQEKLQQLTSQCDELRATVNNNNQALEVVESLVKTVLINPRLTPPQLKANSSTLHDVLWLYRTIAHSLRQQLQQSAELNDNGNAEIAKLRKQNAQLEKSILEATAALEVNDATNANANQQNDVSTQKTSESKEHWLQVIKLLRVETETHRAQMLELTQHLKESTQALDAQVALNATRLDRIAELTGELRSVLYVKLKSYIANIFLYWPVL